MKFQAIVLASFLVMPYALADDQGGLKQDAAPPPPHAIEDGYRGTDDAKKMTVDFAKKMHDGASVSLVVGGAITRPAEITARFTGAINAMQK